MNWFDIFEVLMQEAVDEEGWSTYLAIKRIDGTIECRMAKGVPSAVRRPLIKMVPNEKHIFTCSVALQHALREVVGEQMACQDPRVPDNFKKAFKLGLKRVAPWLEEIND